MIKKIDCPPVLMLIFNRPDKTLQVFQKIREQQPRQLFIAADGARNEQEKTICNQTRAIVDLVDWECEVQTLFREQNLGCGSALSEGITWFFNQVEYGIVLEDDCLPSDYFFVFCAELLKKYKNDDRIMLIAGVSYTDMDITESYYFSRLAPIWGWASWARAWQLYDYKMKDLEQLQAMTWQEKSQYAQKLGLNKWSVLKYFNYFQQAKDKKLNTWDFQVLYSLWQHDKLSILPTQVLVQNIGFDTQSTHTAKIPAWVRNRLPFDSLDNSTLKHPTTVLHNPKFDALNTTAHDGSNFKKMLHLLLRFLNQ